MHIRTNIEATEQLANARNGRQRVSRGRYIRYVAIVIAVDGIAAAVAVVVLMISESYYIIHVQYTQ